MTRKRQKSFFDVYAHEYDILTTADVRIVNHRKEINTLIDRFNPASVLDAGCATGLSAALFAEREIKTLGYDRAKPMIDLAKEKYDHLKPLLKFKVGEFEKIPVAMHNKFEMVACLANSLSGVGSLNNLYKAFLNFSKALKPGGALVIQLLNYVSINDGEFLPIKATRNGDIIYQRFSERYGKRLYIYLNRLDLSKDPLHYEMFRHEFENFTVDEVINTLKKTNFKTLKKYSDLFLDKKFTRTARDLVITGIKV